MEKQRTEGADKNKNAKRKEEKLRMAVLMDKNRTKASKRFATKILWPKLSREGARRRRSEEGK